jgi:hypothetical protein
VKAGQEAVRTEMARDIGGNALNRVHRRKFRIHPVNAAASGLPDPRVSTRLF